MGKCNFCNQSAGFFRGSHKECKAKNNNAIVFIENHIGQNILRNSVDLKLVNEAASEGKVIDPVFWAAVDRGFSSAVITAFDDGVLSEDEEIAVLEFTDLFRIENPGETLSLWSMVVQGALLRDLANGIYNEHRFRLEGPHSFNFQKSEKVLWMFPDVSYFEEKTRKEYVGRSAGVRIRLAKGIYYSTGAFRGHPVETSSIEFIGSGDLCVTNKHLYFSGGKPFRVRLDKIVSFEPYDDGVGFVKEAARPIEQIFRTGEGWFLMNLLQNATMV